MMEEAPAYTPKAEEDVRKKAMILAMRADEAAQVVESFGTAVMNGTLLINSDDINRIVDRLRYYARWLEKISKGETNISEHDLEVIAEYVKGIHVPKKNTYKRDIIEVTYVMTDPETGKATRIKLHEQPTEQIYRGDTVKIPQILAGKKYGHRLPAKT